MARAQVADVDQLPAHFRIAAFGAEQRAQFVARQRLPAADEDLDVEIEPIAAFGRGRVHGDVDDPAGCERDERIVEPHVGVVPARPDRPHDVGRAIRVVQRKSVAAARNESRVEKTPRESARRFGPEAHETPGTGRHRAVRVEGDVRAAGTVDESYPCQQRPVTPSGPNHQARPFGVGDAEGGAFLAGEKRRDPGDGAHRRHAVAAGGRFREARGRDHAPCVEGAVQQIRSAVGDQPGRRSVDHDRVGRRDARAVGRLEHRRERRPDPVRAQARPARFNAEGRQFARMPVLPGRVVEAQPRMARQPEHRARQRLG